jgi:tRNA(Ile)-lysidine synthase
LLAIMAQMQLQWQSRVGTVSCNHLWQDDSFYSLFHVSKVCLLLNQSFYFVPVVLRDTGSNEGTARIWRHNTVQRVASFYQYRAIWTGHTGSDRVETLLFNLMRGSGKRGLSSLHWSRFLTPCYPEMCHLSNFDGASSAQKKRFFPLQGDLSKARREDFRQICAVSNGRQLKSSDHKCSA